MSEDARTLDDAMKLADKMVSTFMQSIEEYKQSKAKTEQEVMTYQTEAVVVHSVAMFILICFLNQAILESTKLEETLAEVKKFVQGLVGAVPTENSELH